MPTQHTEILLKMFNDLKIIVSLTYEAKFLIDDLHIGNICWNGENVVLIDYGEIKHFSNFTNESKDIINKRFYVINWDLLCVIRFGIGSNYYHRQINHVMKGSEYSMCLIKVACKSKHWQIIKKYLQAMLKNTDISIDGRLQKILTDIECNIFIKNDVEYISEFIDYIWCIIDEDEYYNAYESQEMFPFTRGYFLRIPLLVQQKYLLEILDSYL
jgi:hypothetical protein